MPAFCWCFSAGTPCKKQASATRYQGTLYLLVFLIYLQKHTEDFPLIAGWTALQFRKHLRVLFEE